MVVDLSHCAAHSDVDGSYWLCVPMRQLGAMFTHGEVGFWQQCAITANPSSAQRSKKEATMVTPSGHRQNTSDSQRVGLWRQKGISKILKGLKVLTAHDRHLTYLTHLTNDQNILLLLG
jgi:hypothetical protein